MRLLHEDEPEQWSEYKRKEVDYEKRRHKRVQYYESVRNAEQVNIEDIPLPSSTNEKPLPATKISLPPPVLLTNVPIPSTLKKPDDFGERFENKEKEPPGVPALLPPNLFDMRELDSDYESDEKESESEEELPLPKRIDPPKDKHDKNIEEFMKEVESAQKKKEEEKALEIIRIDPTPAVEIEENVDKLQGSDPSRSVPEPIVKPHEMMPMMGLARIPHPIMFRPPPMRPTMPMGIRMPPGLPPSRPNIPGVGMNRMGIRMAPGPPLGPSPRHKQHHHQHHDRNAPPKDPKSATITAKPQIRNLSADVMRFVPATLRVKRDEPKRPKPKSYIPETKRQPAPSQGQPQKPKDDAYQTFMKELQDLL